jgi:cell division septal protein FtsQ
MFAKMHFEYCLRKTMNEQNEQKPLISIRERRRKATRGFVVRVCLLLLLMGGVAYAAWLAPWARPARTVEVQVIR